jgi:predicted metal-dependent TIM-barrel fold hydrolase
MRFIDPAFFASCRSMPELELLAAAGAMAVVEPITWPGLNRRFAESFLDDFERLIVAEARRALSLRLGYAACLGVPPQEARQQAIATRVVELMPRFLGHERVAGIGEIGLAMGGSAEEEVFRLQVRMARCHGLPMVVRVPPCDAPAMLARMIALLAAEGAAPSHVLFNGASEELMPMLRATGCWIGLTVGTGLSVERAVQLIAHDGPERLMVNSGAGRESGELLAVPKLGRQMLNLGFTPDEAERVIYHQPKAFFSQAHPLAVIEAGRQMAPPVPPEAAGTLKAG